MLTISTVLPPQFVSNAEYFKYPSRVQNGFYCTPLEPGYSVEIFDSAIEEFEFPYGTFWRGPQAESLKQSMLEGR